MLYSCCSLGAVYYLFTTYTERAFLPSLRLFKQPLSLVEKLLKQYRKTGSISPKIRTQQTPRKLSQEELNVLSSIVSDNNDATLDELRLLLEQKTGVLIGRSTLDRMLRLLNLNLKKNTIPNRERE